MDDYGGSGSLPPPASFFLPIISDSSGSIFPDNALSHFHVRLAQPMYLEGEWLCGLAEIMLPVFPLSSSRSADEDARPQAHADTSGAVGPVVVVDDDAGKRKRPQEEEKEKERNNAESERKRQQAETTTVRQQEEEVEQPVSGGLVPQFLGAVPEPDVTARAAAYAVPMPRDAGLGEAIRHVRGTITDVVLAGEILDVLRRLPLAEDVIYQNFVDPAEETDFITLPSGKRLEIEHLADSTPFLTWLRNLLTYMPDASNARELSVYIAEVWSEGPRHAPIHISEEDPKPAPPAPSESRVGEEAPLELPSFLSSVTSIPEVTARAAAYVVPMPHDATLAAAIGQARSSVTDDALASEILDVLRRLPLDSDIIYGNFTVAGEEKTDFITLPSGERQEIESLDVRAPFLMWVRNLLSYMPDAAAAKELANHIVDAWSGGRRRRRRRETSVLDDGTRLFIYCDVIQSSPCSDFRGRCLRILPLDAAVRHQILFPVYYYPVEMKVIDTVHMEIKTKHGRYFPFPDHEQPVVAVLHFRRYG